MRKKKKLLFLLLNLGEMLEAFYHYFDRCFRLTETDKSLIKSVVSSRVIKKGEFLVRAGEMAKFGALLQRDSYAAM